MENTTVKPATREELATHLEMLNEHWKLFGDIEDGRLTFGSYAEKMLAKQRAEQTYLYAELWLAEHGYKWHELVYDKATKSYSLPEQGEHANDER